ncbi:MAG: hypothetical protein HN855_16260 [Anaerolineae bacterium]|jgi:hypothetical protein|nr:hypothetical protein [Anaerolineae bacterium]MBT7069804.1 hypothetical protein [Anaerolineae bacterium]MBT7326704.1 hypothetical protein [Anaerolineae bacterium]
MKRNLGVVFATILILMLSGCIRPTTQEEIPTQIPTWVAKLQVQAVVEEFPSPVPTATATPAPQLVGEPISYGPNAEDFPEGINPLTGLPASDPALLKAPAMLLSIPHFPASARPQSGLSFTPWVFEFLIGEGTTRLLGVFYGEMPFSENPIIGDCEVRTEPFVHNGESLGNLVWLDKDGDGIQSAGEPGVGGVCVNLYDANGKIIQQTSTDSNGFYGFNVEAGASYQVEFMPPAEMDFSPQNIGDERFDSDAEPLSGMSGLVSIEADYLLVDAGLTPPPNVDPILPDGKVGPIRSGRLIHIHIQDIFQYSCMIFAGATEQIYGDLPACAQVHNMETVAGAMLEIERFETISEKNAINRGSGFNYASNLFSEIPPEGGFAAEQLNIFFSSVNQTKWIYETLTKDWARYVDNASKELVFTRDTDKLTGRELSFENVIVLFVEHEVIQPRIADMHLEIGQRGKGYLFRDGQSYNIRWSTRATDYERSTGLRRPIAFQDLEGNPIALRPGQSWIVIATPYSKVSEPSAHQWKLRVYSPPGFGEY